MENCVVLFLVSVIVNFSYFKILTTGNKPACHSISMTILPESAFHAISDIKRIKMVSKTFTENI